MNGNSDFEFNLDLLPYPAQASIIRHLQLSSDDVENLGQAFPVVGEIADFSKTTWKFQKVFPSLVAFLPRNDALKCRRVCFTWMQVIDDYLQNLGLAEPDYTHPELANSYDLEHWAKDAFGLRSCWIEKPSVLPRFMEKMGTHPKNPFISRCVQINDHAHSEQGYWSQVKQFLERFGNEIWKLRLGCYSAYPRATQTFRDLLHLTPNLKVLSLEYNGINPDDLTAEEEVAIDRDLEETPFPALPNLIYLDWSMCTQFYNVALPQYSQHLVHVKLMDTEFMDTYDFRAHGTFPSIKSLVVKINHEEDLWKLEDMTGPLKTVTTLCSERISLQAYFQVFHHFAATLESMNIEFEEEPFFLFQPPNFGRVFQSVELNFPVLKCLRLENPDPLESLDVLLNLKPGPKNLKIQTYIRDWLEEYRHYQLPLFQQMDGESVQIHGFLDRMQESKIWELMPNLQSVDMKAYDPRNRLINEVYTRPDSKEIEEIQNEE